VIPPTPLPVAVIEPVGVVEVATAEPVEDVLVPLLQLLSVLHDGAVVPGTT